MPAISDERREERRQQVLEAARACLIENGLEAVSMEMIIARSGLSTGAVYGYFKGKDEIIHAVVSDGTKEFARQLVPILENPEPPPFSRLVEQVLKTIVDFGSSKGGVDRTLVSVHGWSHSQSDPNLKEFTRSAYGKMRALFVETVRRWQEAKTFDDGVDPDAMGELLTSICLGFVAQRALAGADVKAHVAALEALISVGKP